jgi:hypothetical protein
VVFCFYNKVYTLAAIPPAQSRPMRDFLFIKKKYFRKQAVAPDTFVL